MFTIYCDHSLIPHLMPILLSHQTQLYCIYTLTLSCEYHWLTLISKRNPRGTSLAPRRPSQRKLPYLNQVSDSISDRFPTKFRSVMVVAHVLLSQLSKSLSRPATRTRIITPMLSHHSRWLHPLDLRNQIQQKHPTISLPCIIAVTSLWSLTPSNNHSVTRPARLQENHFCRR